MVAAEGEAAMVANSTASGTAVTPSASEVMMVGSTAESQVVVMPGGEAEVAPGATSASGAAAGAVENSLFLGAREEGRCLAGRRCKAVFCFSASKAALTGVSVRIAVVLKTLKWTFKC